MEKDIGEIPKNNETKIIIRVDDFNDSRGLTIREFVSSERYTGFTKAGVRIKSENFEDFKKIINSISPEDIKSEPKIQKQEEPKEIDNDESGIDEQGLM